MAARPLRLILTLQTVLVALLPFVAAAGLGALWLPPQIRSEVEARQGQLAGAVASQVETYLTASLASVQDLAAVLYFEEQEGGHLQQILDTQVRQDGALRAIYVTGGDGRVKAVAVGGQGQGQRQDLLGMDMSRNSLFRQIKELGGPVWSDTFLSVVGGGLSVALAVPSGRHTVIGELRLDNLSRHLQHMATVPQQLVLVLDRRGQVIADQEGRHTAQQLNVSDIPLVRQGLAGGGPAVGGLDFDGLPMIGSLVKAPTLDWYVLVALPAKAAYQPLLAILGIFAAALVLTLLAGLAAAVWLSRRLAGRFETLAEGARRIASGQEVEHWPASSIREFQALAGDLQHMAQAVRQREESLRLSEAKFRRLAQSSPLGLHLYRLLPDGRLVLSESNPAADAIAGLDHRQILGRTIEEAFPGLAGGPAPARFRQVAAQGGVWQDDQVAYHHGGVNRVFEVRAFQDEPGQVAVLFNDITQRKRAEEAIRHSEATLRGIYRASPAGIGMISFPERRLLWANERLAEMSGYGLKDELIGLASRQVYPSQEEYERVGRLIEEGIRGQGVASVETQMVRKDGSVMDVLIKCAPLEPGDPTAGLVFMLLDVTEAKRLARDKADLESRLRQAQKMEAVGTLAGGIAHDFNNILAIIMGNADMARDEAPAQGPQAEMLGRILSACQRGKGLVNQILAFSRQRGRQPLAVDPAVILKETLKLLKSTLPANIKIEQRLVSGGSCLLADPTELHQMLMNLCANAHHAMGQDGGTLSVELAEVQLVQEEAVAQGLAAGGYFRLSVGDTGRGMDQATRERVFEPYFTTKAPGEGSGLGLAVVHGLVRGLGGAISVQSQPGRGTTFQILLPVAQQAAAAPLATDGQTASRGSGRILLVDDEPEVLSLGQHMLGRLGYVVSPYPNGAQAWQAFQADPGAYDAVVTDQAMPEMTGLTLARRIRSLPSAVPIILCTGYMEPSLDQQAQELGIAEVINKPYSKARLATAVQRALGGGQPPPST